MTPAIDALDRARRSLWRALECDRLGMVRDNFLCQTVGALDDAGERDLADRVTAALDRLGGDGRDLHDVLAEIDALLACAEGSRGMRGPDPIARATSAIERARLALYAGMVATAIRQLDIAAAHLRVREAEATRSEPANNEASP